MALIYSKNCTPLNPDPGLLYSTTGHYGVRNGESILVSEVRISPYTLSDTTAALCFSCLAHCISLFQMECFIFAWDALLKK